MSSSRQTHKTAIVLIPPRDLWHPIQSIRRRHDRQVNRWMPHVTLIYPFRSRSEFEALEPALTEACAKVAPFEVTLRAFRTFRHGRRSSTVWLDPEPLTAMRELQSALQEVIPDCDHQSRYDNGFTPHLSVGQFRGSGAQLENFVRERQEAWQAISFCAHEVALIWRGEPPDDVFRVDRVVSLGDKLGNG